MLGKTKPMDDGGCAEIHEIEMRRDRRAAKFARLGGARP
jgi:hypothetical protein